MEEVLEPLPGLVEQGWWTRVLAQKSCRELQSLLLERKTREEAPRRDASGVAPLDTRQLVPCRAAGARRLRGARERVSSPSEASWG